MSETTLVIDKHSRVVTVQKSALESANEVARRCVPVCTAFVPDTPPSFTSTAYTFDEVKAAVKIEALDHVRRFDTIDRKGCALLAAAGKAAAASSPWASALLRCLCSEPVSAFSAMFDPMGADAARFTSKSALREHLSERSHWADLVIRSYTIYHNGAKTEAPLLDDLPGLLGADSKSRFHNAARKYKLPTEDYIRSKMPKAGKSESTHPFLAAGRYATVASLREVANSVGALQYDPCISSNHRDDRAYGHRPIHQLKDLGHSGKTQRSIDPTGLRYDHPGVKTVPTLIDCLAYDDSLAKYSGNDMIIWTSYYPELAGETCESVYYADSDKTFVEIIGKNKATSIYKRQYAWDFGSSDVIYIENEDHSAFTIYNVIRHYQPALLKQVVFLCALQTVNMPYAIANQLVLWTKNHDLESVGIGTPHLCANVVLVPKDPLRPFTQDILVMANGTPGMPTVSIKYKNETSPRSCAYMTTPVYNHLKYLNAHGGRGLTVHEAIKRLEVFKHYEEDVCVPGSAAYCELLRTVAWWGDLPNVVYYGVETPLGDVPEEAESAKAVMAGPNLTEENPGVLAKTPAAMDAYVEKKMIGMANTTVPTEDWTKISDVILTAFLKNIAKETGVAKGSVLLVDKEKILEARTKAVQKARQVTDGLGPSAPEIGRVEMKTEVAHKTKACARAVQNPEPEISILSGVLGKSLETVLKKCGWYNPGSTPTEISESVSEAYRMSHSHELNFEAGGVRSIDYEAADDRHCKHSNRILRRFIEFFFSDVDKAEALKIYDRCFDMPLQVGPKVRSSKKKNASGTGITTVLNTGVFAQRELETTTVGMVFRSMQDTGELKAGEYIKSDNGEDRPYPVLTHKTFLKHLRIIQSTWDLHKIGGMFPKGSHAIDLAYRWIGPKFGDDGLDPATPYVDDGTWERAMLYVDRMDGFVRKIETTSAVNEEPVEYLSRIYPCPLRSPSSYCKVEKAINKISIAINRDPERYYLKLRGYHGVDGGAPIVGAYLTALSNLYGIELTVVKTDAELNKIYEQDRDLYFKIVGGPHPTNENTSDEFYSCVAADYGMTSGELREFDDLLRSQTTWSGIQAVMLPKKLICETVEDPLGLQPESADPPNVKRVAAFSTLTRGEDVRMCNFESRDASTELNAASQAPGREDGGSNQAKAAGDEQSERSRAEARSHSAQAMALDVVFAY